MIQTHGRGKTVRRVMTDRTIRRAKTCVYIVSRWHGGCDTTGRVTASALCRADGTVVHVYIRPARVTMAGLTGTQTAMVLRPVTICRVAARDSATDSYRGMIDCGRTEIEGIVTGGTVHRPGDTDMQLIGGCGHGIASAHMTRLAHGGADDIMVHPHRAPARITMAVLTAGQHGVCAGAGLVTGMATRHLTARNETTVIQQRTAGKAFGTAMAQATLGTRPLSMDDIHRRRASGAAGPVATQASGGDAEMFEFGGTPSCRLVAGIAIDLLIHCMHRIRRWQCSSTDLGGT